MNSDIDMIPIDENIYGDPTFFCVPSRLLWDQFKDVVIEEVESE